MSAIVYVTDSKMLELHRLNNHKTMNFWRVSTNVNFSDFGVDDLVFFLSKDKEHKKKNEKGIVGFGRLKDISVASTKTMWNKYHEYNGYMSLEEFKKAISKVAKDKKLPSKISSFYLENVTFFQPIYLSECGINISNKVESYIYLKDNEVVLKLLKLAKHSDDLWSSLQDNESSIELEEAIYSISASHKAIKDIKLSDKLIKKARRVLKTYLENHENYYFIQNSDNELYKIDRKNIEIVFYHDKDVEDKLLIGQAHLYKEMLNELLEYRYYIEFKTSDNDRELEAHLNS